MSKWNDASRGTSCPIILFATPPALDKLLALSIRMTSHNISGKCQPQVIKCREFIFTEPDVIGTPSLDIRDSSFHLVAHATLINTGKLQTRMARIGLQVSKAFPVSPDLYEACLRYTVLARISPSWNKAGPWLIQGRDFLTNTGVSNAIKMDLSVRNNELYFTLEAAAVKTGPLNIEDLDIPEQWLQRYKVNSSVQIFHENIGADWCFVLPSMKRGRIVSISHDLPEESPFMSYRDIKRHWKNTYGYRLPETEEDMNFCQVQFSPIAGRQFTYPEVCLRPRDIQRVHRVDPKPILRAFMLDIQSKFPTICGLPLKLQSKAKFTVAQLIGCNEGSETLPNLTSKMSHSRPAVYRSKTEMQTLLSRQSNQAQISHQSYLPQPGTAGASTDCKPLTAEGLHNLTVRFVDGYEQKPSKLDQQQFHKPQVVTCNSSSDSHVSITTNTNPSENLAGHSSSKSQVQFSAQNSETPQQNQRHMLTKREDPSVARKLFPHFTARRSTHTPSQSSTGFAQAANVPAFMVKKKAPNLQMKPHKDVLAAASVDQKSQIVFKSQGGAATQTKAVPMFQKCVIKSQTVKLNTSSTVIDKPGVKAAKTAKDGKTKKRSTNKESGRIPKEKKMKKAEA